MAIDLSQKDSLGQNRYLELFSQDKSKILVASLMFLGLFLLSVGAGLFLFRTAGQSNSDIKIISASQSAVLGEVVVHVDGAVKNPGIYKLAADSRVNDAVVAAGGLSQDADSARINLAARLSDGTKVYIPSHDDPVSAGLSGSVAGQVSSGLININTATEAQLDTLPGIGPVTASKIISLRPYSSLNELLDKKAVSKSTFEKIKGLISL